MQLLAHPWRNGGDDKYKPSVSIIPTSALIVTDGDVDADGSPRVGSIDPKTGQSETSLRRSNGWQGENSYVNSETVPFYVLPLNWAKITGLSASLGDMAKLTYGSRTVYAIFADQGPNDLIGEASICAVEALGFNPWNADGTRIVRGIPHGVSYEIRPGSANLTRTIDFDSIQAYGLEIFGTPSSPAKAPAKDNSVWNELKRGDKGQAVEMLQKELNEHFDAKLVVDGDFGKKTEAAVMIVEEILGFPINGTADVDFWKAIGTLKGLKQDITKDELVSPPTNRNIIPFAEQCKTIPTAWEYQGGWPQGAILHFTAGRDNGPGTVSYLGSVGFPCIVMSRDGRVWQGFSTNRGGCHCGTSHHDYSFGLEVCAAGICEKLTDGTYKSWFGETIPASDIRTVARNGSRRAGAYQVYTAVQEEAIIKTFLWYKWADPTNRFSFDKVLGHDEACDQGGRPGAKNDPGGALSMTMPEFRALLKKRWSEFIAKAPEDQLKYFGYK